MGTTALEPVRTTLPPPRWLLSFQSKHRFTERTASVDLWHCAAVRLANSTLHHCVLSRLFVNFAPREADKVSPTCHESRNV